MKRYVLDASALMTLFEDRPGADKVEDLLRKAVEAQQLLLLSVIQWGEVYYSVWRNRGEEAANQQLGEIAELPIEVLDVDQPTTKLAAALKATYRLPYADCFAAAVAQQRKATLVTADKDFAPVEEQVSILWAAMDRQYKMQRNLIQSDPAVMMGKPVILNAATVRRAPAVQEAASLSQSRHSSRS